MRQDTACVTQCTESAKVTKPQRHDVVEYVERMRAWRHRVVMARKVSQPCGSLMRMQAKRNAIAIAIAITIARCRHPCLDASTKAGTRHRRTRHRIRHAGLHRSVCHPGNRVAEQKRNARSLSAEERTRRAKPCVPRRPHAAHPFHLLTTISASTAGFGTTSFERRERNTGVPRAAPAAWAKASPGAACARHRAPIRHPSDISGRSACGRCADQQERCNIT